MLSWIAILEEETSKPQIFGHLALADRFCPLFVFLGANFKSRRCRVRSICRGKFLAKQGSPTFLCEKFRVLKPSLGQILGKEVNGLKASSRPIFRREVDGFEALIGEYFWRFFFGEGTWGLVKGFAFGEATRGVFPLPKIFVQDFFVRVSFIELFALSGSFPYMLCAWVSCTWFPFGWLFLCRGYCRRPFW